MAIAAEPATRIGASLIAGVLRRMDIRTVFSLAGGGHQHILDQLDRDGVRIIGQRHESAVMLAADGYARITGKVGIAICIANQGISNAIGGLASAHAAGSPVVVVMARPRAAQGGPGLTR